MNKFDWFLLMGIVFIMLVGIFSITFYFNYVNAECSANPFVYGSKQLEKNIDANVYGTILLINSEGKHAPRIEFNSSEMKIIK